LAPMCSGLRVHRSDPVSSLGLMDNSSSER
jgi:hypothetical protein